MYQRPKRRRYKDNPYYLEYGHDNNFYVIFKDSNNILRKLEISEEIFNVLDQFELDDLKELNEFDRHIEHNEVFENTLMFKAKNISISIETEIEHRVEVEELYQAIEKLSLTQKRRIEKYYFEEKKEHEIAKEEDTTQQAINKSLNSARQKLKEILKNQK